MDLEEIIINELLQEVKEKLKSILPLKEYSLIERALDLNNLCYLDEVLCEQNRKR